MTDPAYPRTITPLRRDDGDPARPMLCALRTWCVLELGHDGPCEEVPRREIEQGEYGPGRKAREP